MRAIRGLVLAATIGCQGIFLLSSAPVQAQPRNLVFVGAVRNNIGHFQRFDGSSWRSAGDATWDTCPQGTVLLGHDFQRNGFWLCASSEISQGTWYFGNVVNNQGYYWEISGGQARAVGDDVKWDTCFDGRLFARQFHPNGYWICKP